MPKQDKLWQLNFFGKILLITISVLKHDKKMLAKVYIHFNYPIIVMVIRCFIVARSMITDTPFQFINRLVLVEVADKNLLTWSLGRIRQEVTVSR